MYIGILGSTTHKADSNTTGGREARGKERAEELGSKTSLGWVCAM